MSLLLTQKTSDDVTVIRLPGVEIQASGFCVMAGPCSIESEAQMFQIAACVSQAGGKLLRGGAFKPRTSPYDFQGLGEEGLRYLQAAGRAYGLATVSEVMEGADIPMMEHYVDVLQLGSRNMQNTSLLKQLGKSRKPILLKRGLAATYQEWLMAAEYILQGGNTQIILCERGIRTFENHTRNTLDLCAIPVMRSLTHLPLIIDPSHGTGHRDYVTSMAYAACVAGAAGIMVEIHPEPARSWSDAKQALSLQQFKCMMSHLKTLCEVRNHENVLSY